MRRHFPLETFVALISLLAILLGALEHEDLIFQESTDSLTIATPASTSDVDTEASQVRHDAGTEGNFRSTLYRFWLSPRVAVAPQAPLPLFASAPSPRLRLDRCSPRGPNGLFALRL